MTILTQDLTFINFDYIKSIAVMGGVIETPDGKELDALELSATLTDTSEIPLGIFYTEEQIKKVIEELSLWLNEKNDYRQLFKIQTFDYDSNDVNKSGSILDYGTSEE